MLIIWRAGDGFMVASEYVGRNLSDGVRGATINAIASSMPEVFTSLFFLFVLQQDGIGFTGGIGTTAGSAIFNSMVIPAVAVLAVISMGLTKEVNVSRKVMLRDGISLIIAEFSSLVEAKAWADSDPYIAAGVYQKVTVKPYKKVLPA